MNPAYKLNSIYDELDFRNGDLSDTADTPLSCTDQNEWLEKGGWLVAAKQAGAEKIFFVKNNPVVIFATCETDSVPEKIEAFNKAWCLSRPRLLFLASPGEITVFDLAREPIPEDKQKQVKNLEDRKLETLKDIKDVAEKLQTFNRYNIESGRVFADQRFGDLKNRADQALIRNLITVRKELADAGLADSKLCFAHALIGRSIFIRYLEDREILKKSYFEKIAKENNEWTRILEAASEKTDISPKESYYPKTLKSKSFTYAIFRALSHDFNGDMFPNIKEEEQIVTQKHLNLIKDLLYGDVGIQKNLFFKSYRFDIIPLELISSIYENFYHSSDTNNAKENGAFYTPAVLVEFVLSRVLTPDVIETKPKVLDPACGSGIFLVEAFRRIVRYEWQKNKEPLTFNELKNILRDQIAGIEINEEAARITAFSLYLSMLHYLDPPAIDQQINDENKLPNLITSERESENHFHSILPINAFDTKQIESNPIWNKRFGYESADIVVGNPPWGNPGKNASPEIKANQKIVMDWCDRNNKPIGDKEFSQAFLWRTLDFLKDGGKAGLLVSAGVLLKHGRKTQKFRKAWFDLVRVNEVFNFSHVREFFFNKAISPFLSLNFSKENQKDHPVYYWSAKQSLLINRNQSVLLSKHDLNIIRDHDLGDHRTWKSLFWGRLADKQFLNYLNIFPKLSSDVNVSLGFQKGNGKNPALWLEKYKELPSSKIDRYSTLNEEWLRNPPEFVERRRLESIYIGMKILIKKGVEQKGELKGRIISNYYNSNFIVNNSVYCMKLANNDEKQYKLLIGILWSSFSRYYYFFSSTDWGVWHDCLRKAEIVNLPIINSKSINKEKVVDIVDKLSSYNPSIKSLENPDGITESEIDLKRHELEAELDEAVFDLYGFNDEQRDLIRDCCEVTLPFYYQPFESVGVMPAIENCDGVSWMKNYVNIFCRRWNAYLEDDQEMHAEIHVSTNSNMIAVEFCPVDKGDPWDLKPKADKWNYLLEQIGKALPQPMGTPKIQLDSLVHVVSEDGIIIIKRNEKRFWTRSLAREDADATICKRMIDTMPGKEVSCS